MRRIGSTGEKAVVMVGSAYSGGQVKPGLLETHPATTKRGPVTVLFADLCGYTSMSETLDPEDLQDVMTRVFGGITRIATKYEAHVDRLLGDGALVLFGVPHPHEDDAFRAIMAAREIREFLAEQSPRLEQSIGRELHVHSAISTGVVVTSRGEDASSASALGDSVNLASRLLSLAGPDEIVCAEQTQAQTQGYFDFEALGPQTVRGREGPVSVYRVGEIRELPATAHRIWGVRAKLIGRRDEWARLEEAVDRLVRGQTTVITVRGDAGTGKSRLVEEFRDSLDGSIRWFESSAQPYSQHVPYRPFIESLGRAWGIQDSDPPAILRRKIEECVSRYPGCPENSAAYIGALFGLDSPEMHTVSSEFWKQQVFRFFGSLLTFAASSSPTVIYAGDLHWVDPSSLELLHYLISTLEVPILVIATCRPPCTLFPEPAPAGLRCQEIHLGNLSPSEATDMIASLLDSDEIPASLREFLQDKAEGNPFYLEELVNSLVESGSLVRRNAGWTVARPLVGSDLPLTVVSVIASRLDRLDPAARHVLQEASVVGRTFGADVLGRISRDPSPDTSLVELQKLDLVRVRSLEPRLEYEFKHALIQDVAYAGLLKPARAELHQRVGTALETMFPDKLPELYETLALHFSRGTSVTKAAHYLARSAEKSFARYAVDGSYEFYRQAYEQLVAAPRSPEVDRLLVSVIDGWAYVIYDAGNMAELQRLLESHRELAESLGMTSEHAMFRVCLAIASHCRERFDLAVVEANHALEMGESLGDEYVSACAHVWLAYSLSEMGRPDEALPHAERAIEALKHDPIYITEAYSALGFARWTKGDAEEALRIGETLLELGRSGPNTRAVAAGHWVLGEGHLSDGDFASAAKCFADSIDASPEPWPSQHPRIYLAISYIQMGRFEEAEPYLLDVLALSEEKGAELTGTPAKALLGVLYFAKGDMTRGMRMLEEVGRVWAERNALMRVGTLEAILGQLYLNLVASRSPVSVRLLARNIGFLARNALTASTDAETHFRKAKAIWEMSSATGSLGEANLGLAMLYKATRRPDQARRYALEAVDCFERAGIKTYLAQARDLLESVG